MTGKFILKNHNFAPEVLVAFHTMMSLSANGIVVVRSLSTNVIPSVQ